MTNEEIKKALRLCAVDCCEHCPYDDKGGYCCGKLKRDALNLISEQEKEIDLRDRAIKLLRIEIDEHRRISDKSVNVITNLWNGFDKAAIAKAKIDVLNELKEKAFDFSFFPKSNFTFFAVHVRYIDEMIEELKK